MFPLMNVMFGINRRIPVFSRPFRALRVYFGQPRLKPGLSSHAPPGRGDDKDCLGWFIAPRGSRIGGWLKPLAESSSAFGFGATNDDETCYVRRRRCFVGMA